jgi:hypothetical protein
MIRRKSGGDASKAGMLVMRAASPRTRTRAEKKDAVAAIFANGRLLRLAKQR